MTPSDYGADLHQRVCSSRYFGHLSYPTMTAKDACGLLLPDGRKWTAIEWAEVEAGWRKAAGN